MKIEVPEEYDNPNYFKVIWKDGVTGEIVRVEIYGKEVALTQFIRQTEDKNG